MEEERLQREQLKERRLDSVDPKRWEESRSWSGRVRTLFPFPAGGVVALQHHAGEQKSPTHLT